MKLVYEKSGEEVRIGHIANTGGPIGSLEVEYIRKPHHPGSTGRVGLKSAKGWCQEFFPAVIGATWIDREDRRPA